MADDNSDFLKSFKSLPKGDQAELARLIEEAKFLCDEYHAGRLDDKAIRKINDKEVSLART
jgi:hypothetical protein